MPDTPLQPPSRKQAQSLTDHPMIHRVLEAMVSGHSCRSIARWIDPPVSHETITKHFNQHVKPILKNAEELKILLRHNKELNQQLTGDLPPLTTEQQIDERYKKAILAAPVLSIRENRINAVTDRHRRMQQVLEERAADMSVCESCRRPEEEHPWEESKEIEVTDKEGKTEWKVVTTGCKSYAHVPGGTSGLILRKLKPTGYEYAVDTALLAEFREHEKHIAVELGQWQEGSVGNVSIQIVCPSTGTSPESMPRITYQASDVQEIDDGDGLKAIGLVQRPG